MTSSIDSLLCTDVMVYEENRLQTFLKDDAWPFLKDCKCTPEKMAEAGFYWCGSQSSPDLVRCFVCQKELEDWDPDDDPREAHKHSRPNCPYIQLNKTQSECTVREVFELCHQSFRNILERVVTGRADEFAAAAQKVRRELEMLAKLCNEEV